MAWRTRRPGHQGTNGDTNEYLQTIYPNIYACATWRGPTIHPTRRASGLVRRRERALFTGLRNSGRLFGHTMGDLTDPKSLAWG